MKTYMVADQFTVDPGARHRDDGDFSGQEFLEDRLLDMVKDAIANDYVLHINFDGVTGLPTSFASEAFGGLRRANPDWSADLLERHVVIEAPTNPKLWPYILFARHALRTGIAPTAAH